MKLRDNQFISIEQAAVLIDWTPQRLQYYLRSKDKIPPHTVQGGHRLFNPRELLKWKKQLVDSRRTSP